MTRPAHLRPNAQTEVLLYLHQARNATVRAIAENIGMSTGTVTKHCRTLQQAGWVRFGGKVTEGAVWAINPTGDEIAERRQRDGD